MKNANFERREGPPEGYQDTGALSSRCVQVRDYMYSGGHERAGPIIPSRVLLRSSEAAECDYPTSSSLHVSPLAYTPLLMTDDAAVMSS